MLGQSPQFGRGGFQNISLGIDGAIYGELERPQIVEVGRHYGLTIQTCVPADPQSKGGSEATVRVAKADLVPTDHNLREQFAAALEAAISD